MPPLEVWSFNLRTEFQEEADGEDGWSKRREGVAELIRSRRPAVICTQEATEAMLNFLTERLGRADYAWLGSSRSMDRPDETAGVLFDKGRLKLLHAETAWFGQEGSLPGTPGWDAQLPRTMELAVFSLKSGGSGLGDLLVVNTHFDHVGVEARVRSAEQVAAALRAGGERWPSAAAVVTGDFNSTKANGNRAYEALLDPCARLRDAARVAERVVGEVPASTIHKFKGLSFDSSQGDGTVVLQAGDQNMLDANHIDWILCRDGTGSKLTPVRYEVVLERLPNGRYPSDHYPISCTFEFLSAPQSRL